MLPLLIIPAAAARIWHVKADSPPGGIGSLERPFFRIQAAADTAVAGDTALVYAGTYYETVIPMHAGVDSTDGAIYYVYYVAAGDGPAIIKAQQNFGFRLGESFGTGLVERRDYIWIEGFYITDGYGATAVHGSGIRTYSNYGVFIHNKIYDNDVGIYCEGSGTFAESGNNRGNYIAHNIISNSGEAAVRIKHSSENDVVFNLMYHNGYRIEPSAAVTFYCGVGNRIINNTMWDNAGGGAHAYNGTVADSCVPSSYSDVRDNIFARLDSGFLLNVENKTCWDTTAVFSYNLFWAPDPDQPIIWWGSNEFKEGGYQLSFSEFMDSVQLLDSINSRTGDGFIFSDPLFSDIADLDFALLPGSPARDAGSRPSNKAPFMIPPDTLRRPGDWPYPPDSVWASQLTVFNTSEVDADTVDLGYHFSPQTYTPNPPLYVSSEITLFPNPYPGSGAVQFLLPNVPFPRRISGQIYNLRGQKVGTLRIPDNPLNLFAINWDTRILANGLYLLNIEVNGRKYQKKLLLLK
ncbi:MAG TPA: right-handed parallel beta-helix repeat-containing protein [bacterium]